MIWETLTNRFAVYKSFFGEGGTIWILNRVFSCPFFVF